MKKIVTTLSQMSLPWMILTIILGLGIYFGLVCLNSWLIMLLWNLAVVDAIKVCAPIGFWEAMCLHLLLFSLELTKQGYKGKDE